MIGNPVEVVDTMFRSLPPAMMSFWSIDPTLFTVWGLTFGLFYFIDPWIYMWAYMAESPKTSSNGMLSILGGSYFNVLPFIAGMALLAGAFIGRFSIPEGLSGDALYAWFTVNHTGTLVGVLIMTGLIMTIVSCGSSFAMNGVTILTNDIYHKVINKNATDKQVLFASRMSLFIVTVIGIACANWLPILIPLWSLGQAIVISGLFAPVMAAWFWKRSTTAGAAAASYGGGIASFAWACYAWINVGSPGGLMHGLHACHVGVLVSVPLMIIVSLATKADYSKALATNYKVLGEELKTSDLVEEKVTRPGVFGWLGADTSAWKIFWVIVFTAFILHYVLAFLFHIPTVALLTIVIGMIMSIAMILLLGIMGTRDAAMMIRGAGKK
jgi:Na+/proline symporter